MSKILELREKRAKVWEDAKTFLNSKRQPDGLISNEDSAAFDKMETQITAYGKEIERLERMEQLGQEITAVNLAPLENSVGKGLNGLDKKSDGYKQTFWNALRGLPTTNNSLKIGTDPNGGYLVPDEFERTLVEALEEENIMRKICRKIPTSSGDTLIPVVATKGTASWVQEEGTIPESDDTFSQVTLGAYKLATMIKVSNELLQDSAFPLESYIAKEFARRIGTKEEEGFLVGTGSNQPTGILATTGGATIGKTTASATAITLDEILDLFYALKAPYRSKATFLTNDSTIKAIRKLKDNSGQYLWQPAITSSTPDMILGKPIYTSSYVPAMAAGAKSILFGDFDYYWIADRRGRSFKRLDELYAVTDQVGFLASERTDGKLILPEAVQVLQMSVS